MALGHPFRAEDDVGLYHSVAESRLDEFRGPRVDRAPQHDQRAFPQPWRQLIDRPLEDSGLRVHELVDGGPDDQHHGVGALQDLGLRRNLQPVRLQGGFQQAVSAALHEGHLTGSDLVDLGPVRVIDTNPAADAGKAQGEGQADMTATPHDNEIQVGGPTARGIHGPAIPTRIQP